MWCLSRNSLLVLILIIFSCLPHANAKVIRFEHLDKADGLASNYVEDVIQDHDGFLWFGTRAGISRYDGFRFRNYYRATDGVNEVVLNDVYVLRVDAENTLWAGTLRGGLFRYDRSLDLFVNYNPDNSDLPSRTVYSILEDSYRNLWLGTDSGFCHFNFNSEKITTILDDIAVRTMAQVDSSVWIGTDNSGLIIYDILSGEISARLTEESPGKQKLISNRIYGLKLDSNNTIWILTDKGGLYRYTKNDNSFEQIPVIVEGIRETNGLTQIIFDSPTEAFLIGFNTGLLRMDMKTMEIKRYKTDFSNPFGLKVNTVTELYRDRDNTIWIPTYAGGVYYLPRNMSEIEQYFPGPQDGNYLSHAYVSGFAEDNDGNLWIGLDGGGINMIPSDGSDIKYFSKENGLPDNSTTDLTTDQEGNIWACMWTGGICKINTDGNNIRTEIPAFVRQNPSLFQNLKAIFIDSQKKLWTANHLESLLIYDGKTGRLFTKEDPGNYPPVLFDVPFISDFCEDHQGNIWISSYVGLFYYNRYDGSVTVYSGLLPDALEIPSSSIISVFEDDQQRIWINTDVGICLLDRKDQKFVNYSKLNELPLTYSFAVRKGLIWMASDQGILKHSLELNETTVYNDGYTMLGNTFYEKSVFITSDNKICFGGTYGFVRFHPSSMRLNSVRPEVYITSLEIMGEVQVPGKENSVLLKQAYLTNSIELNYKQSVVTFRFAALNFVNSESNHYRYKLENFDEEWVDGGNTHHATYTNLEPGDYIFRIIASNNDGVWNLEGSSLHIHISPPFWQTLVFRIISVALIISFVVGIYYYRITQVMRQKSILENTVKERTYEIRQKNEELRSQTEVLSEINSMLEEKQQLIEQQRDKLKHQTLTLSDQKSELEEANAELTKVNATKDKFFSIIAHDLKNPFNSILGFSELLVERAAIWPAEKTISMIQNVHKGVIQVYTLLENLLQWSRSQRGIINFNPELLDIVDISNSSIDSLIEIASKKSITIVRPANQDAVEAEIDENMFRTIIRNLMTNAIKFTPEKGKIEVLVKAEDDKVKIEIADSGIGMSQNVMDSLFSIDAQRSTQGTNNEEGTGLGLILCKEFTDRHQGQIEVQSEISKGSVFKVTLPKLQNQPKT